MFNVTHYLYSDFRMDLFSLKYSKHTDDDKVLDIFRQMTQLQIVQLVEKNEPFREIAKNSLQKECR